MAMQIDQTLCAGCGACIGACPRGAIYLTNHRAVIDETLCIQCQSCVDACPNGAIAAVYEPIKPRSIAVQPKAETLIIPAPNVVVLPEASTPARGLAPLAGAALAFLGREIAPRLVDVLANALDRRLTQPKTTVITPANPSARICTTQRRGAQRQARYRGGRSGFRNQKGRR